MTGQDAAGALESAVIAGKIRVVYLAGFGRSGSTLLSTLLGNMRGFVNCGELRYLWERGILENRRCGCGEPFHDCPFWRRVVSRAYGGADEKLARRMAALDHRLYRIRAAPLLRCAHGRVRLGMDEEYLSILRRLYAAIRAESGCDYIVDASKLPGYGLALQLVPGLAVDVVHLVRDPRAVAFSWQRKKQYEPGSARQMDRFGATRSSAVWLVTNVMAARLARNQGGRAVRYEDVVQSSREAVTGILAGMQEAGRGPDGPRRESGSCVPQHTVAGNPMRFERSIGIRLDDEWERGASRWLKFVAAVMCRPLMRKYGYR